jgi:hypothetical protein
MGLKARLKPQDLRDKCLLGKFGYNGKIYTAGEPETDVSDSDANFLRTVHEIDGDPHSPLAFHIWDPEREPAPEGMTFVPKKKGEGITAADLRGEFISRSEMDGLVSKAVREAVAQTRFEMVAAIAEANQVASAKAQKAASVVESQPPVASEPAPTQEKPAEPTVEVPKSIPDANATKLNAMFPQLAHKNKK